MKKEPTKRLKTMETMGGDLGEDADEFFEAAQAAQGCSVEEKLANRTHICQLQTEGRTMGSKQNHGPVRMRRFEQAL